MKLPKKVSLVLKVIGGVIGIVAIAFINYQIISSWFGKPGPANLGSIEVSYVSMGRFLRDFGFKSWAPFWYLGFPFHLFYTPALPFFEYVLNASLGLHLWETYRLITGVSYVLVPVSLFLLGWQLSRKLIGGLVAAVLYSVGPSVFYFLIPEVAEDRLSPLINGFLDPRRLTILVRWGEGPHTLSLVFLPLAALFFARHLAAKKSKFSNIFFASLFLGLAALSNALGFFASVILILSLAFARYAQKTKYKKRVTSSTIFVILLALGLISFWYNLSFITNFFGESGGIIKRYLELFPWGWLAALFLSLVVFLLIKRFIKNWRVAGSLVWFLILFAVVATYYFSAPAEFAERRVELLPQALRYTTEVDMALSLLIGVLVGSLFSFFERKVKVFGILGVLVGFGVLVAGYIYIQPFIPVASNAASQFVDLDETREKQIADWLNDNVDITRGERVFLPGNYGFYLNWYTDVWQHRGALFQAASHRWPEHIHFQMANGEDEEISTAWLKAINAKYAVITVPGSNELYKEIKNPERFTDLKEVYRQRGDLIYEVPLVRPSLAKTVSASVADSLIEPEKADSKDELLAYVNWVENSSDNELEFEMLDHDNYKITGEVGEGEAILVQMTYDAGWSARDNGKKVGKQPDPLGFLVLNPEPGEVNINLTHSSTWRQWLGYLTTAATLGFIAWFVVVGKTKNRRPKVVHIKDAK